jgi:DNA repair protein RecO (recombination protein O)
MTAPALAPVHALVLRSTDVGETSRLVGLFTAEHARITVRARGVRSRRSRDAAVLEPFNIIEARILHREERDVQIYAEGSVLQSNAAVRSDVTRAAAAALWSEILDQVSCAPGDAPATLAWAQRALAALETAPSPVSLGLLAGWQLLGELGHQPVWDRCLDTGEAPTTPLRFSLTQGGLVARPPTGVDPATVVAISTGLLRILEKIPGADTGLLRRIRLSSEQTRRLTDLLGRFCECQLEIRLRSLRFLQSVSPR